MPYPIEKSGLFNIKKVHWNHSSAQLYEHAITRGEAKMVHLGPLVTETVPYTGRSPMDRFIVKEQSTQDLIAWGDVNVPFDEIRFEELRRRQIAYLQNKEVFVEDCMCGHSEKYSLPIRVITEKAWHCLFAHNMFVRYGAKDEIERHVPEFTVIHTPGMKSIPEYDGTNSEAFVVINLAKKLVLICGTSYAGEIKKSIFSVMNFLLPQKDVLPMHCSANIGPKGNTALFFGLSGTGKTTLSADPERRLIGDDEHGWSEEGIFNFEGGCYAKVINLSQEAEPDIYETTRRFGTILENVVFNEKTRHINLFDGSLTENTRASYPISHIPNALRSGTGSHPKNIIFLTADAFGVMPPISKLTPEQAMYHFLSGYTAKVAGTERGITEPRTTFSACFGEPFLPLPPSTYAELLVKKMKKYKAQCWLVNTGWTGGPYGEGHRMKIQYTRAMLNAAIDGNLEKVDFVTEPFFGLSIPKSCPGVPAELLNPKDTWDNPVAYDEKAEHLAEQFNTNFEKYKDSVPKKVFVAGPKIGGAEEK
jgi:phosphoenolpyruvate carboxykinase (ATP)